MTKSKSTSTPGLTPISRKRPVVVFLGLLLAVLLLVGASLWVRKTQEEGRVIDEMKATLAQMYDVNQALFKERGAYSLNFEEIWERVPVKPKNPSRFVYGFQKSCVSKYASYVQVASHLDASKAFEGIKFDPKTEVIRDAIASFLQPANEEIECISPREGFLLFAVGARTEGTLDVWIVNHEKTIANIRPDGGASLEGI